MIQSIYRTHVRFYRYFEKESKIMMLFNQIPLNALSMINGKLLGDGNISLEKKRKPRLRFSHTIYDKEWCFYCYEQLNKYIPFSKPKYRKIKDERTKLGFTEQYYVQSLTSEIVDALKELWYPHGKKVIPFSFFISYVQSCLSGMVVPRRRTFKN
jgi:LAGLIDADG DNA endonuclease family